MELTDGRIDIINLIGIHRHYIHCRNKLLRDIKYPLHDVFVNFLALVVRPSLSNSHLCRLTMIQVVVIHELVKSKARDWLGAHIELMEEGSEFFVVLRSFHFARHVSEFLNEWVKTERVRVITRKSIVLMIENRFDSFSKCACSSDVNCMSDSISSILYFNYSL